MRIFRCLGGGYCAKWGCCTLDARTKGEASQVNWEVLNGVGVDGVGVIFPFFYAFFPFFYAFFPFFFAFVYLLQKMGNFTPTPRKTSRVKLPSFRSALHGSVAVTLDNRMSRCSGPLSLPPTALDHLKQQQY